MKNKRGALELSVNAVVIIIIAIVMLGLALTFMRSIFGGVMEQFQGVSQEVQKQMEDTLRATTKKATLSTNSLELKAGENKRIYLGINNYLQDDVEFCIACSNCKEALCAGSGRGEMECSSFEDSDCLEAIEVKGLPTKTVLRGKIDVVPLEVKAQSNAPSDTYLITILVYGEKSGSVIEEVIDLYVTVG